MKKIISAILVLSMTLGILSGCGSKEETKPQGEESKPAAAQQESSSKPEKQEAESKTPGTELSDFLSKYTDTKTKLWEEMTKKLDMENNLNAAMGMAAFAFADLAVVNVLMFDALTVKDGDVFKGKLMLTGIDAWKKVNGDIIEFGYDYTYPDQNGNFQKGDRGVSKGKLEKSKNSLIYEYTTERDGKAVDKTVIEITRNADASYSSQTYFVDLSGGNDKNVVSAYLTWFDDKNVTSYMAEKETADINFSYNSIFGKKDVKPEEMAAGMTVTVKTSYINGEAKYEDLSGN
jgi:hypothetical protein